MAVSRRRSSLFPPVSIRVVAVALASAGLALGCSEQPSWPLRTGAASSLVLKDVPSGTLVVPQAAPLATFGGVAIHHGGYGSALVFDDKDPTILYTMTDRGANVNLTCGTSTVLAFGVPSFTPQIGKFRLSANALTLESTITLKQANGTPLTGFPHPNAETNRTEIPATLACGILPQDPLGIDSEGLAFAKDGTFWVSDEYGPDIVHFSADGRTLQRLSPGNGLPLALARRRSNRGMEGLTILPDGKTLVGIMQSPLDNPTAGGSSAGRNSRLARIVVVDTRSGATKQYAYLLDAASNLNSEIAALTPTTFLVLERDGSFPAAGGTGAIKKVYKIDIENATDISDPTNGVAGLLIGGRTLEEVTRNAADPRATLLGNGITAATKALVVDLLQAIPGYPHDKVEGLAVIDNWTIAISNDDDFGVGDDGAGHFVAKTLPLSGATDFNTINILRLSAPLKDE